MNSFGSAEHERKDLHPHLETRSRTRRRWVGAFELKAEGVQVDCHFLTYVELDSFAAEMEWKLIASTSACAPDTDSDECVAAPIK